MLNPYFAKKGETTFASGAHNSDIVQCPSALRRSDGYSSLTYACHPLVMDDNGITFRYGASAISRPVDLLLITEACQVKSGANPVNADALVYKGIANRCNSNGASGWISISYLGQTIDPSDDTVHNSDSDSTNTNSGYIRWRHTNNRIAKTLFADLHADFLQLMNT